LQKIIAILTVFILLAACTASRKSFINSVPEMDPDNSVSIQGVEKQNITNHNFFIEKIEFKLKDLDGSQNGFGSVKFVLPDKYLISIKSRTGIEVARIFITTDTLLINDRINKKLYCGSNGYLQSKYGITTSVLPVLFGDYINNTIRCNDLETCQRGRTRSEGKINEVEILYILDCGLSKIIKAVPRNGRGENGMEIAYNEFFRQDGLTVPGKIEISDIHKRSVIELTIKRVELQWEGEIEFIPGKQYEIIHLL
jgi:hypothetical protein